MTEPRKDEISSIPKLLELNLEESHKTWGDEVEDALKLEDEARNKSAWSKESDRRQEFGSADLRRYEAGRSRGEIGRTDDRPPAKKSKDEPMSYRSPRDGGYPRDRTRGGRSRGKGESFRGGASRGGKSSANDFRGPGRDSVVSEYQPSRGEKRGTLTFERSDLHPERQTSFDNKRGQYRSGDTGGRREDRNRDGRGKDGRENYTKKDDRIGTSKPSEAWSASEGMASSAVGTLMPSSEQEPARTNAWSLPLQGSKQGLDEITDISNQLLPESSLSQQEGGTDPLRKNTDGSLADNQDKTEIEPQTVESRGNDRDSRKVAGSRAESYRSDRGPRQPRRGRRQNWSEQADGGEGMLWYTRRSQPRANRDGRGPRAADDGDDEAEEAKSREDRNQNDRRRSSRFGSGGRGLRQSGHGEYSMRSRGRGSFTII